MLVPVQPNTMALRANVGMLPDNHSARVKYLPALRGGQNNPYFVTDYGTLFRTRSKKTKTFYVVYVLGYRYLGFIIRFEAVC